GGDGQDRADRPRANGDGAAGRDGGDGGEGGEGGAGDNVAVIVANRSLTMTDSGISDAVQVLAGDGGTGGDGGAGGDGGDGGAGNNESGPLGGEGGDGGDGGSGGNGGDGGDGGSGGYAIAGIYFTGDEDDAELTGVGLGRFMSATAGDAGEAGEGGLRGARGEGGAGGSGGTFAANGENGAPGAFGSAGSDGQTFFAGAVVGPLFPEIDGLSAPDAVVYVTGTGGAVTEGESLTVSLVRAGSVDAALTVSWTLEGGEGFAADDVAAFSGTARFEAGGPDVIEIEIATLLDDVRERDERFAFRLLDATPAEGSDETAGLGTAVLEAVIENARGAPDEVLTGTRRRDVLRGDRQDEDFFGLAGKDKLIGGGGADILHGGRGKDKLLGGGGQDVLHGGLQTDKLVGGRGADVFLFQTLRDAGRDGAGDRIVDFGRGADLIDLSGIDADAIARGDQAFTFIGAGDFSETAGELRQIDNLVQGDVNGDGEADFELRLLNGALLTSDDFVL
ncbi:MAG: M10 family metallopeptidase C-terminal domain-containing protein, partial [Pseudomonadota bacterium]|nr:M10 family metallopeptidase C-terminal domain-containing protein [Pseudomonadota bacterium]